MIGQQIQFLQPVPQMGSAPVQGFAPPPLIQAGQAPALLGAAPQGQTPAGQAPDGQTPGLGTQHQGQGSDFIMQLIKKLMSGGGGGGGDFGGGDATMMFA